MTPIMSPSRIHAKVDLTRAQMQLVIAEVSAQVDSRADKNMREARKAAQDLREIAKVFDELPYELIEDSTSSLFTGPECVLLYRASECLAAIVDPFRTAIEAFIAEHGTLVEEHSRESVERFCTWVLSLPNTLRPYWLRYVSNFEAGLEAAAVEQAEIADEWSTVDSDGLNNAA